MSLDILIVLVILFLAVVLFATELISVDLTAMIIMGLLLFSGILTAEETLSGFSNSALVTVAAMFVLSAGVQKSGALNHISRRLAILFRKNFWLGIILMMMIVGVLSAFINNTPVVALFIPVIISCAELNRISPEKLLIPLSFGSMFGGVCTLIGTSTNILVSDLSDQEGFGPFGMFEMFSLGGVFFIAGLIYMVVFGIRKLPGSIKLKGPSKKSKFHLGDYVTNIVLLEGAPSVGKALKDSPLVKDLGLEILFVFRKGHAVGAHAPNLILKAGDRLKVKGDIKKIHQLSERKEIALDTMASSFTAIKRERKKMLVETVILPNSKFCGRRVSSIDFEAEFGADLVAVRERHGIIRNLIKKEKIRSGDTFLLSIDEEHIPKLKEQTQNILVVSRPDIVSLNKRNASISVGVILTAVILASLDIVPILAGALAGVLVMALTRCISVEDMYQSISWKVLVLLAGSLSLGVALKKTGAATILADGILEMVGTFGPLVILSALYLLSSLLTEAMSNNATVVLLAPIVFSIAQSLDVDPKPFLMAITFAGSASFMTPVGYQTNTMVYASGAYRFKDFFTVGAPLNLIFWILATFLIPVFFPF
jgi:di/tricarboxylate transporter